jgi:Flp pilus assembly pilin Flp
MMTFKRQEQAQGECDHATTEAVSWAGLQRERCTECGNVSISFLETARTGVLFAIPRDGERGAALAEWGLLVVLVAVVALIAVGLTGEELSGTYDGIATTLTAAGA